MTKSNLTLAVFFLALSGCSLKSCSWFSTRSVTELSAEDLKIGDGESVQAGAKVSMHYRGWLYDASQIEKKGKTFDNSYDRQTPVTFVVAGGKVLPAWDRGVIGMKLHGRRRLFVPAKEAYGERGASPLVPPHQDLVYDIELVDVAK